MRKRIWRLSEGQFDSQKPKLEFSTDKIEATGYEGTTLQGDFIIRSTNDVPMRGMVYSSNPYMVCLTPQFDGVEVKIRYEVHGEDFLEGDSLDGKFTIVFNQGEEDLPFVVQFMPKLPDSSMGPIDSIEAFARLAQNHWNEALQVFYSEEFAKLMHRSSVSMWLLYQGYRKAILSSKNLEHFLVASGAKETITYELEERQDEFYGITENQKESIEITKNTWGYIELEVRCDAAFVSVEKERITSDFFLGSKLYMNYYIHKDKMHAGINSARITFDGNNIHKEITVVATTREIGESPRIERLQRKKKEYQLTHIYEEYRLRRMTTGDWCKQSIELIDELKCGEKEDVWLELMKAQAYITNKQRQEALWIISDMKKAILDKQSVEWAYLLYLCSLIEPEEAYVNRLTREVEVIFRYYPEDTRVFWFLLFMREEYCKNNSRKLKAITQWIEAGCHSPYLYMEAYYLYLQDPYLLTQFDDVTIKVLHWTMRRKGINADIALQLVNVATGEMTYKQEVYEILKEAYRVSPGTELLMAILSYLLKGQQFGEKYLRWYKLGIEREIRMTGLYEAYLMSLPNDSVEEMPQIVTMYFKYNSNISYQKKALLYGNVITNKDKNPQIYEQYLRSMELFAMEQMDMGRIDDNLAIIYQNIMDMEIINDDIAKAMSKLVFAHKVISLYPNINRVIVYQEQFENPFVYPVIDGCAYVPLISKNYQLFLEDSMGGLISSTEAYYVEELMHTDILDKLRALAPGELSYILHYLDQCQDPHALVSEDMHMVDTFITSKEVAIDYKVKLYPVLITFLKNHTREELMEDYLMEEAAGQPLDANTLSYVIELLVTREHYEKALSLVRRHNSLGISIKSLVTLCDQMILQKEYDSDDFLISMCSWLLEKKEYTAITVSYLMSYYVGPDDVLVHLWHLSEELELPNAKLEERLIVQMLYEEDLHKDMPQIIDSYYEKKPNKMVMEAYLSLLSHRYLTSKEEVAEHIFSYLYMFYLRQERLNECCKIALMKYLALKSDIDEEEYKILDALVKEYILKNIYFGFYKQLDHRLIVKYHLYDKIFVEYHGNARERITMTYTRNDADSVEEEMIEMYEGIFVKQFVMFFGDTISYELYSEAISDLPICSDKVAFSDVVENGKSNRYELLNQMQSDLLYGNDKDLIRDMKQYQGLKEVSEQLFTTI